MRARLVQALARACARSNAGIISETSKHAKHARRSIFARTSITNVFHHTRGLHHAHQCSRCISVQSIFLMHTITHCKILLVYTVRAVVWPGGRCACPMHDDPSTRWSLRPSDIFFGATTAQPNLLEHLQQRPAHMVVFSHLFIDALHRAKFEHTAIAH